MYQNDLNGTQATGLTARTALQSRECDFCNEYVSGRISDGKNKITCRCTRTMSFCDRCRDIWNRKCHGCRRPLGMEVPWERDSCYDSETASLASTWVLPQAGTSASFAPGKGSAKAPPPVRHTTGSSTATSSGGGPGQADFYGRSGDYDEKLSHDLVKLLRHKGERILRQDGFAPLDAVLRKLQELRDHCFWRDLEVAELRMKVLQVVGQSRRPNGQPRFEVDEGLIRALDGHTVKVETRPPGDGFGATTVHQQERGPGPRPGRDHGKGALQVDPADQNAALQEQIRQLQQEVDRLRGQQWQGSDEAWQWTGHDWWQGAGWSAPSEKGKGGASGELWGKGKGPQPLPYGKGGTKGPESSQWTPEGYGKGGKKGQESSRWSPEGWWPMETCGAGWPEQEPLAPKGKSKGKGKSYDTQWYG